jgi:hypothetical protein
MEAKMKKSKKNNQPEPMVFVIFGGSGDLTWRKLMPSLFDLHRDGRMPNKFAIIAVGRSTFSNARLRAHFLTESIVSRPKGKRKAATGRASPKTSPINRGIMTIQKPMQVCVKTATSWIWIGKGKPAVFFTWLLPPCCLE